MSLFRCMTQELSKEPLNEIVPADLDTMTATKQTLEDYTLRFAPRSSPEMVDPGRRHFRAGASPLTMLATTSISTLSPEVADSAATARWTAK
jgi:hypothetical protein